jgi:hypothetical protein
MQENNVFADGYCRKLGDQIEGCLPERMGWGDSSWDAQTRSSAGRAERHLRCGPGVGYEGRLDEGRAAIRPHPILVCMENPQG